MTSEGPAEASIVLVRLADYRLTRNPSQISIEESARRCEAEPRRTHNEYGQGPGYDGAPRPEARDDCDSCRNLGAKRERRLAGKRGHKRSDAVIVSGGNAPDLR